MRKWIAYLLFIFYHLYGFSQKDGCENKLYPAPVLNDSIKKVFEQNLRAAEKNYRTDSINDEHIIWYGRRLAYLGFYKEAIDIYSKGIKLQPANARFYRHRGHRYITLRCYDKAIEDLVKAAALVKGRADETEADGMPNALNIPLSTLQTNIWYHLGLAYYLKGENEKAAQAYETCLDLCENDDMKAATLNWLYITLRRMGKNKEAYDKLKSVSGILEIIENQDYLEILLMYAENNSNRVKEKTRNQETLSNATLGFGLGNFYLLHGDSQMAKEIFEKVTAGRQWTSFGYIAAEEELKKIK
jgi:tetratricopeptide (TPR) repeat protein